MLNGCLSSTDVFLKNVALYLNGHFLLGGTALTYVLLLDILPKTRSNRHKTNAICNKSNVWFHFRSLLLNEAVKSKNNNMVTTRNSVRHTCSCSFFNSVIDFSSQYALINHFNYNFRNKNCASCIEDTTYRI